jgi:hypothetical protein
MMVPLAVLTSSIWGQVQGQGGSGKEGGLDQVHVCSPGGDVVRWRHFKENRNAQADDATKCRKTARVAAGRREMQGKALPGCFSPV